MVLVPLRYYMGIWNGFHRLGWDQNKLSEEFVSSDRDGLASGGNSLISFEQLPSVFEAI